MFAYNKKLKFFDKPTTENYHMRCLLILIDQQCVMCDSAFVNMQYLYIGFRFWKKCFEKQIHYLIVQILN